MDTLARYYAYTESDRDLLYHLRMGYDWDEQSYQEMINLVQTLVEEYSQSKFIPKIVLYFFTSKVDLLTGLVTNPLFHKNPPRPFTSESYKAYVDERVDELSDLKRRFLNGEL